MSDLIDRHAAIELIERMKPYHQEADDIAEMIANMPSAQPEPHYDEWCTDCKEYDHERHCCPRWNRVIRETLKDVQPNTDHIYAELSKVYNVKGLPDEAIGIIGDLMLSLDGPSAQPERLTDDDFETIRIHLNAYKEKLCNQKRWKEAEEYQRIIDRFMAFASAQPERKTGKWMPTEPDAPCFYRCDHCGRLLDFPECFCPTCGTDMRGESNE